MFILKYITVTFKIFQKKVTITYGTIRYNEKIYILSIFKERKVEADEWSV